jgi:hypothetical protein
MTILHGFRKSALLLILAVTAVLPVCSQTRDRFTERRDSIGNSRIDSLYQSLNDTAAWQRELDFVRNLRLYEVNDSDLIMEQASKTENATRKRQTWKEKEEQALAQMNVDVTAWEPDPRTATWMALIIPGGGQIYNHKYWKLPIVYGGFVGCIYALSWNQSTYKDYQNAYVDIMDDDPNTKSYEDFLPPHYEIDTSMEDWLKDVFKQRKNKYRRYRDLSIFAFAGMYVISAIDAYVDAELSHFDISPDLSFRVEPDIMINYKGTPTAGFSLAFNF